MTDRSYSDAEVDEILRRAIEREQAAGEGLGHDELLAAAREVGLPDEAVERAIREVEGERSTAALIADVRAGKRGAFWRQLFTYLTIAGAGAVLHFVGLLGAWVLWPIVIWAAILLLAAPRAFREPDDRELDRAERKRNRHARRRLAAQARQRAKSETRAERRQRDAAGRSPVEAEIERAVEEGVAALLRAAADKLAQSARGPTAAQGDFGRYVARREGREKPAAPIPVQVRVSVPEPAREEAEREVKATEPRDRARK